MNCRQLEVHICALVCKVIFIHCSCEEGRIFMNVEALEGGISMSMWEGIQVAGRKRYL